MSSNGHLRTLDWDTEFFGVSIARADVDGANEGRLVEIEREAHDRKILCAYATVDPTDTETSALIQRFGYRLVEVGMTFRHPDGRFSPRQGTSAARRGTLDDLPLLEDSIDTVGAWSRFGADPRFGPEEAKRMYRAWIERAARSVDGRMLSITEDDSGLTGFATHVRGEPDRMDLVSVTKAGAGAADALYSYFHEWARPGEVEAGDAAARNVAIIRFLERCGYRVIRSRYHFHRWFDENHVPRL